MNPQFFLGLDVGKYTHQASLINNTGQLVCPSFKFANDREAFQTLLLTIKKQLPDKATVKVGLEATGHYYWHLKDYLESNGLRVQVFNPIETQTKAKTNIRKVKNDRIDSLLIAKLTQEKSLPNDFHLSPELKELRQLTRFVERLKCQERYYKQAITVLLERIAPELSICFNNLFLKTPLKLMTEYFLKAKKDGLLINLMVKSSRGRIKATRAKEIVFKLNNSLGKVYRTPSSLLELNLLLQSLELLEKQIKIAQLQMKQLNQGIKEIKLLTSLKGVSEYMANVIISEIGNINRFERKEQLTAFAGLDPSVKQSGRYLRQQGNHISKRGSKNLRRQLYYAAKTAIMHDPELKVYYQKKKSQGKHYNCIMIAVARKMLMRIWAVLKQNRPYELRPALIRN